jgi:hypothetical protein
MPDMEQTIGQNFSAPMGKTTIGMTAFASAVLFFVGGLQLVMGLKRTGTVRTILFATGSLLLVCLAGSVLLKIRGYELTQSYLVIKYGFSGRKIPIADIREVSVQPNALGGSRREAANGGLWSFLGSFYSPRLGQCRAYVSDPQNTVVITLPEQTIVISPDDPNRFMQAVKKQKGTG